MTSTQTDIVHQLASLAAQLEAQTQPTVDSKYVVTSEFAEVPKEQILPLLKEYRKAKAALDKAKAKLEAAEKPIKDLMDGAEVLVDEKGQYYFESRVTVGQIFDSTRFKKENPDLAAKFLRERYSRNFRVLV